MKKTTYLLLGCLLLSACVRIGNDEVDDIQTSDEVIVSEYEVLALPEPNHYQVSLPVPEGTQAIERQNVKARTATNLVLNLSQGKITDEQPEPGALYIYRMGSVNQGQFQEIKSFQVEIPQDLDIQNEIPLSADTEWTDYRRIFLGPRGLVTTQGYDLKIKALEIYSDGGSIQTLKSSFVDSSNFDGRAGGKIEINTKLAEGILNLNLRGQNGQEGNIGTKGGNGGNSGSFRMRVQGLNELQVSAKFEPGTGGNGFHKSITIQGITQNFSTPSGAMGARERACVQDSQGLQCQ